MQAKKNHPFVTWRPEALSLPQSAFRVYWILCKFRDNRTGTAYASPHLARVSPRQLKRILCLLQAKGLIRKEMGKWALRLGPGSVRVRAQFWEQMPSMGVLRFKAALAVSGPTVGLSAESLRETLQCRKSDACRLLKEVSVYAPAIRAETAVFGSRMTTPPPRIQKNSGSQVSRLSTKRKKQSTGKPVGEFLAIAKYREFLVDDASLKRAIELYEQARSAREFGRHGNLTLADGVLFAFLSAGKAKSFGGYFWSTLRRNLLTGYCALDIWRKRREREGDLEKRRQETSQVLRQKLEAEALERRTEDLAEQILPGWKNLPVFHGFIHNQRRLEVYDRAKQILLSSLGGL